MNAQNVTEIQVCYGATVNLTAHTINGGTEPIYQWIKNNVEIENATNSTYSYIPVNGDTIFCRVTSNADCVNPLTVNSQKTVIKMKQCADKYFYVSVDGAGDDSGIDWDNAMCNLTFSKKLLTAGPGDIFYLKEGVYYPQVDESGNETPSDIRRKTYTVKQGVTIIGSYKANLVGTANDLVIDRILVDGTGELSPATVFTGDFDNDNIPNDANDAFILISGSHASAGDGVAINGLEIRNAYMGGVVLENTNLSMDFCKINKIRGYRPGTVGALKGGVLYCYNGQCTIQNSSITENSHAGGAGESFAPVHVQNGNLSVYNSVIANNYSTYSSAITFAGANKTLKIYNSTITNNITDDNTPNAIYQGAIYIDSEGGTVDITSSTIVNNSAIVSTMGSGIVMKSTEPGGPMGMTKDFIGPNIFKLDNTILAGNNGADILLLDRTNGPGGNWMVNTTETGGDIYKLSWYQTHYPEYSIIGENVFYNGSQVPTAIDFTVENMLAPLAYNGGYTQTRALMGNNNFAKTHGNPIYKGSVFHPEGLHLDQRGEPRMETVTSIGAYETNELPFTTVAGTVFPFVRWEFPEFDNLFPITVSLKSVPDPSSDNPLRDLIEETPLYSTLAKYYDGSTFVPNSPKSPGMVGALNNYGLPINWLDAIGVPQGAPVTNILIEGEKPVTLNGTTLGLFILEDVAEGDYILEIKRDGFVTRWAKIYVNADQSMHFVGHREIVAGDVNDDLLINLNDLAQLKMKIGGNYSIPSTQYSSLHDLNSDGKVDQLDFNLVLKLTGFWFYHYEDTMEWLQELGIELTK
jgi:hypothetical protein